MALISATLLLEMAQPPCPTCGSFDEHHPPPATPRFSELLSANTPPLDTDVHGLRQIIQEMSANIDSLHSHIRKAQERLSALMASKKTALCRMADAKKILHPMRSLPQDILIDIFLWCTPIVDHHEIDWYTDSHEFDSLSPRNHPWNISHVSHRWREIALALPRLWSVIYLDFTRYTSLSPQQCSFVGSLLFERSANLDLSVNIATWEINISAHPLVAFLKESTTRWRILNSHMSSHSLQSLSGCEFPLLQELGVGGEAPSVDVNTFKNVQNVRTMHFYSSWDMDFESYSILGEFPWSKLSKLSCSLCSLNLDFLSVLQQLTCVEEATLIIDITYSHMPVLQNDIDGRLLTLPALRRLRVQSNDIHMENFFHVLRVPSICCLSVIPNKSWYWVLAPHPDFHRISTLRVTCSESMTEPSQRWSGDADNGTQRLLKFLRPMSGVEEFRLKDNSVSKEFLDGLVAANDAVLFPSLTTLDLHECGFGDHDEALRSILRIVESRSLKRPLQRIVLPREDWLDELVVDSVVVTRLHSSYVLED